MKQSKTTYKRLFAAAGCLALLVTFSARANFLAEDFNSYTTNASFNVNNLNGGTGWSGPWNSGSGSAKVGGGNLAYTASNYGVTQSNVTPLNAYSSVTTGYRGAIRSPASNLTNAVWFSALMLCSNSTSAAFIGFDGLNTNNTGGSLDNYSPSTTYSVGISNTTLVIGYNCNAAGTAWSTFTSTTNNTLTVGNAHLILGCITFQSYGNLDTLQVWADPPDLTHLGAPQWQETANDIGTNLFNIFEGGDADAIDAIRFSDGNGNPTNAYTDVTGTTNLNAFPTNPAPSTLLAEDFNYAVGNLSATVYNGGIGWAGRWSGSTTLALVSAANSLAYSAGGYSITQSNVSGSFYCSYTAYRGGVRYPVFGGAPGDVWFTTLMLASNSTSQAYIGFNSANTNTAGSTSMNYMPSTTYSVGISNTTLVVAYGANSAGVWSSFTATTNNNITQGVPHLILGHITFTSGNSTVSVWADPPDLTHPGLPQWSETAHNIGSNLFNVSVGAVTNGVVDAIRFSGNATAYTDVTGTTNLSVPPPTVVINPATPITGNGSNFTFTTTTTGSSLAYQWSFDSAAFSYGTNSTLTVTNASSASRGFYSVTVTNLGGPASASTTLEVTNCNLNLVWEGGAAYVGPTVWDIATTNWGLVSNPSTIEAFGGGDTVTFDDTFTNKSVSVQGVVNPGQMNLNSTNGSPSGDYTFNGGTIGGTGQLIDNGTANVTFNSTCAYTGGTVTEPSSFGGGGYIRFLPGGLAGNVLLDGAGLGFQNGNGTFAGNITGTNTQSLVAATKFLSGFTATLSGNLSHAGGLSVNAGTVVLTGSNSYAGDTTVGNTGFPANKPVLRIGSTTALPSGAGLGNLIVNGNPAGQAGLLDLNGFNVAINGLFGTATNAVNGVVSNGIGTVTLTLGNGDTNGNYPCDIVGGINITKVGLGEQIITGGNLVYAGNTVINAGTLALGGTLSGAITVNSGGTLAIGPTNSLASLSANGITLGGALSLKIDKDSGLQNDVLTNLFGTLTLAGTLNVANISTNSVLASGDTFTLFGGALTNSFTSVNLPPLTNGLAWSTNYLSALGQIAVITAITPGTNAYLTSLVVSNNTEALALNPGFTTINPGVYAATNVYGSPVSVTVTNGDSTATTTLLLNGVVQGAITSGVPSLTLSLGVGSNNIVAVQVVSQSGTITNLYQVAVYQLAPPANTNAYLTGVTLMPVVAFTPTFGSNTLSGYMATENYGVPFTVTVTNGDATATNVLTYNGGSPVFLTNGVASGSLSMNVNPAITNTLSVLVTAQDGITTKTYAVNVVEIPSQAAFKLTNSVSGGTNLVMTWPVDHTGYRLLTQTNNLSKGVSSNTNDWGTVPDYTGTNAATILIAKTNLNAYYRLVYP